MTSSPSAARTAVEPRVCSYPSYGFTDGDDAIDLAAAAGLILDPWQQFVLRHALGVRDDGKWVAFEVAVIVARQNGKNSILEARELAGLLVLGEKLILHSAHEYKTAMEAFRRVLACLRRLGRRISDTLYDVGGVRVKVNNTNGEEGFERLDTGARLKFIARSKGAGRGFSADCVIWDEAYALTEDQVDAQMPTLSAMPNAQIWYTSSPPLDAVSGAQLFRVRRRALAGDDAGLAYFDWGAAGSLDDLKGVDLDDRQLWRATNPAFGIRITEEAIERERNAMSDQGFARERLSIWPPDLSQGFQVIPEGDWTAALDEMSQIVGTMAFAAAVSRDRTRASIAACGRRRDGKLHIEVTSREIAPGVVEVDNRAGTGWVPARLLELKCHKPCAIVLDNAGGTGSLIPAVKELGIEPLELGMSDAAKAFGMFYDAVSGSDVAARNLKHLGQPELTTAVASAGKRTLGEGFTWDSRTATTDITPVVAATHAMYGFALKGHVKTATPWVAYA